MFNFYIYTFLIIYRFLYDIFQTNIFKITNVFFLFLIAINRIYFIYKLEKKSK